MSEITKDTWKLGEHEFSSRFILGSGKYSLELIDAAVKEAKAEIVTMALRRANESGSPPHIGGRTAGGRDRRSDPGRSRF